MNIERELSLANFSYHLKANPEKVQKLAIEYYAKFLEQQEKINNLERNRSDLERSCKKLEAEKKEIHADYELLRKELEEEQKRRNSNTGCDLHLSLPTFLPSNPHNYL